MRVMHMVWAEGVLHMGDELHMGNNEAQVKGGGGWDTVLQWLLHIKQKLHRNKGNFAHICGLDEIKLHKGKRYTAAQEPDNAL